MHRQSEKQNCSQTLTGTVVRVCRGRCYVRVANVPSECAACKACALAKSGHTVVSVRQTGEFEAGDTVAVFAPKPRPILAIVLLLLMPLLGLAAGFTAAAFCSLPEPYMLLCAGGGLAVGFLAVPAIDRLALIENRYRIAEVTNELWIEEKKNG